MFPLRSIIQKDTAHRQKIRTPLSGDRHNSSTIDRSKRKRADSNDLEFYPRIRRSNPLHDASGDIVLTIPATRLSDQTTVDPVNTGLLSEDRAKVLFGR